LCSNLSIFVDNETPCLTQEVYNALIRCELRGLPRPQEVHAHVSDLSSCTRRNYIPFLN